MTVEIKTEALVHCQSLLFKGIQLDFIYHGS